MRRGKEWKNREGNTTNKRKRVEDGAQKEERKRGVG